jgi:hypothetical protein
VNNQLHAPAALASGKESSVPIGYGGGGAQSRYGHLRSGENPLTSARNRTPAVQLAARRYTWLMFSGKRKQKCTIVLLYTGSKTQDTVGLGSRPISGGSRHGGPCRICALGKVVLG